MLRVRLVGGTKYRDRGASLLARQIDQLGTMTTIDVGFMKGARLRSRKKKGLRKIARHVVYLKKPGKKKVPRKFRRVNVATYAWFQEDGTKRNGKRHIPKRPFMSHTVKTKTGEFERRTIRRFRAITIGNMRVNRMLKLMAGDLKSWFKETIVRMHTPINRPSTLRNKRKRGTGSNPLLDSRAMLNAVDSRIVKPPVKARNKELFNLVKVTREIGRKLK